MAFFRSFRYAESSVSSSSSAAVLSSVESIAASGRLAAAALGASRSWLSGCGARGGRGGGGVVVLVAAGGGCVVVRLVVAGSRSVLFRPFGVVAWFVFVFLLLLE